jgi:hypothetical protein
LQIPAARQEKRVPNTPEIRHPAAQALYAYWNEVRGSRLAPRRLEIQPARIGGLLLDTFILEHGGGSDFHIRLAGTRVASRFNMDLKSRDFLACWSEGDRSLLEYHLSAITELGRIGLFTGEARINVDPAGRERPVPQMFELLALPLVHTGQSIDRLLCLLVPLDEEASIPDRAIQGLRLLAAEAIWPDGAPEGAHQSLDRQLPLSPQVRTARIVRQGRRQFRVYDGGRDDAAQNKADRI